MIPTCPFPRLERLAVAFALALSSLLHHSAFAEESSQPTLEALAEQAGGTWEPEPFGQFKEITSGSFKKAGRKPKLTPELLIPLLQHPEVKSLYLDNIDMDLESMRAIAAHGQHLEGVLISNYTFEDAEELRLLAQLPNLRAFFIGRCPLGDEALRALSGMKKLTHLTAAHVSREPGNGVTAEGLQVLADNMPDLEYLAINLHRMDDDMIPALQQMKNLKQILIEWISPTFAAKLREALPGVEVTGRAHKYVRDGFDPATFDPAKDFVSEDGTPLRAAAESENDAEPAATPAPEPAVAEPTESPAPRKTAREKAEESGLLRTTRETDPTLPPIDALAKLNKMLNDEKTYTSMITTAREGIAKAPERTATEKIRLLLLTTAPIGPMAPARNKGLHALGAAGMIVLLREMAEKYPFLEITEVTDEAEVTREMLENHDVVFLNNVGQTDRSEIFNEWLPEYVAAGGGLVANHGSLYLFSLEPDAEYNRLIGAYVNFPEWDAHPKSHSRKHRVRSPHPEDPLVTALRNKTVEIGDELYNHKVAEGLQEPPRVLVEYDPEGMPFGFPEGADDFIRSVVWTRTHGKGNVWYLQTGHIPSRIHDPVIIELLIDGILHASGQQPGGTDAASIPAASSSAAPSAAPEIQVAAPRLFPFFVRNFDGQETWLKEHGYWHRPFQKHIIDLNQDEAFGDGKLKKWIERNPGGIVMLHFKVPATEADEDRALPELRRLCALAEENEVDFTVYPYHGCHIDTALRAQQFVRKLDYPGVGLTLHLPQEIWNGKVDQLADIAAQVKDDIDLVVIAGADRPAPGDDVANWEPHRLVKPLDEGSYDLSEFVEIVKATGYDGPWGFLCWGIKQDPKDYLARSMEVWKRNW